MDNLMTLQNDNIVSESINSNPVSTTESKPSNRGKRLTKEQRQQVLELFNSGVSRSDIASKIGCSHSAVNDIINKESVSKIADRGAKAVDNFTFELKKLLTKKQDLESGLKDSESLFQTKADELKKQFDRLYEIELQKLKNSILTQAQNDLNEINNSISNYKEMLSVLFA
ncbi:MAG: helix-turn-helix domain-containing protein [Treponema sp.]